MSGKVIVGSKNCKVVQVLDTIKKAEPKEFAQFVAKWSNLARQLGTNGTQIATFRRRMNQGDLELIDVLTEILDNWMATEGEDATLDVLMGHLTDDGMKSYADELEKKFMSPASNGPSQTAGSSGQSGSTTTVVASKVSFSQFITANLPALMEVTGLYPRVLAILNAAGVLSNDDESALEAYRDPSTKKREFYKLMQQRPNCYNHLLEAFKEQSGVIEILKRFENN